MMRPLPAIPADQHSFVIPERNNRFLIRIRIARFRPRNLRPMRLVMPAYDIQVSRMLSPRKNLSPLLLPMQFPLLFRLTFEDLLPFGAAHRHPLRDERSDCRFNLGARRDLQSRQARSFYFCYRHDSRATLRLISVPSIPLSRLISHQSTTDDLLIECKCDCAPGQEWSPSSRPIPLGPAPPVFLLPPAPSFCHRWNKDKS